MDSIVIVDHQSDRRLLDPHTNLLLEKYDELGSDVWKCDGSFDYKQQMWMDIIHEYTKSSEFVSPLDVDELITVKVKNDASQLVHNDTIYHEHSRFIETQELR